MAKISSNPNDVGYANPNHTIRVHGGYNPQETLKECNMMDYYCLIQGMEGHVIMEVESRSYFGERLTREDLIEIIERHLELHTGNVLAEEIEVLQEEEPCQINKHQTNNPTIAAAA